MPRALKLCCAGAAPLLLGLLFNYVLLYLPVPGVLLIVLECGLLAAWGCAAFRLSDPKKNPLVQAFLLSGFGLAMLALVLYQELVLGQYWGNFLGLGTQVFFLPFLTAAASVVSPFMEIVRIWPMYIVTWICLFLIGCAGCLIKRRG